MIVPALGGKHSLLPITKTGYAVFLDEPLMALPTTLVGSGESDVQIELAPVHLKEIVRAEVLALTVWPDDR